MITKEQAQAHKSAFQQSNAKTPAFVQTVSASVCMDYLNTIIALHERVERLTEALIWCSGIADFGEGGIAREGWLKLCAPLLKETDHD